MKPILCIDVTLDKKNEQFVGDEFITASTPKEIMEKHEQMQNEGLEVIEKAKLPLPLRIVKSIAGFISLILLLSCLRFGLEDGFVELFKNSVGIIFLIVGAICGGIWLALNFASKKKEEKVFTEENIDQKAMDLQKDDAMLYAALGVPETAENVDFLMFRYKVKNGEIKPQAPGLMPTPYINFNAKAYDDGRALCVAGVDNAYSFPKDEMKAIRTVNKSIALLNWNKDEEPTKGKYKEYKLGTDNMGLVHAKPYHILEIEHNGELYGLYFPCYELPVIERLTGLRAENSAK
jgi:hypothetical protein